MSKVVQEQKAAEFAAYEKQAAREAKARARQDSRASTREGSDP